MGAGPIQQAPQPHHRLVRPCAQTQRSPRRRREQAHGQRAWLNRCDWRTSAQLEQPCPQNQHEGQGVEAMKNPLHVQAGAGREGKIRFHK